MQADLKYNWNLERLYPSNSPPPLGILWDPCRFIGMKGDPLVPLEFIGIN